MNSPRPLLSLGVLKKFVSESQFVKSFVRIGDSEDKLRVLFTGVGDMSNISPSSNSLFRESVGSKIEPTTTSKGSTSGCKREPVEARLRALLALLTLGLLFDGAGAVGPALTPG